MDEHKFKIGETVRLMSQLLGVASGERYEIVKLLPPPTDDRFNYQYRLRVRGSTFERVGTESDLSSTPGSDADGVAEAAALAPTKRRRRLG